MIFQVPFSLRSVRGHLYTYARRCLFPREGGAAVSTAAAGRRRGL